MILIAKLDIEDVTEILRHYFTDKGLNVIKVEPEILLEGTRYDEIPTAVFKGLNIEVTQY